MKIAERSLAYVVLSFVLAIGQGRAQEPASEKHVADIRAEQPASAISASPLCDRVRTTDPYFVIHDLVIDPATLEPDLTSLMQKSDEVLLVGTYRDRVSVLARSRDEPISYFDARVLRSWKGSHKAGDLVTFSIAGGTVTCWSEPGNPRPSMPVTARLKTGVPKGEIWSIKGTGPTLLFLRHSQGDEVPPLSGLRLTGGNGVQGLFSLHSTYEWFCDGNETRIGMYRESIARCNAMLYTTSETVKLPYHDDPLQVKYEGMPVPKFLQEVQAVSDSFLSKAERDNIAGNEQRYHPTRP